MNVCLALAHLASMACLFGWNLRGRNMGPVMMFILVCLLIWTDFVVVFPSLLHFHSDALDFTSRLYNPLARR